VGAFLEALDESGDPVFETVPDVVSVGSSA
jgi:hypothetical protein